MHHLYHSFILYSIACTYCDDKGTIPRENIHFVSLIRRWCNSRVIFFLTYSFESKDLFHLFIFISFRFYPCIRDPFFVQIIVSVVSNNAWVEIYLYIYFLCAAVYRLPQFLLYIFFLSSFNEQFCNMCNT